MRRSANGPVKFTLTFYSQTQAFNKSLKRERERKKRYKEEGIDADIDLLKGGVVAVAMSRLDRSTDSSRRSRVS